MSVNALVLNRKIISSLNHRVLQKVYNNVSWFNRQNKLLAWRFMSYLTQMNPTKGGT